jgi:predicted P-loop ATPase/GTPase
MIEASNQILDLRMPEEKIQVLVVGLLQHDSGKTTLTEALVIDAIERGFDVGISKPVSAMSGWYQYDCILRSIEYGMLIGEDLYRLHEAADSSDPLEIEGPVVSLLMPPDPERVNWESSAYLAYSLADQIVVVRVTNIGESRHFYIPVNLRRLSNTLRKEVKRLLISLHPRPIEVEQEFTSKILLNSYEMSDECLEYIVNKHEFIAVESYNNAAAPTRGSLNANAVIAVAPSKAAVFDGNLYRKALIAISGIKEPWQTTTEEVLQLLKPSRTLDLRPTLDKIKRVEGLLDSILEFIKD